VHWCQNPQPKFKTIGAIRLTDDRKAEADRRSLAQWIELMAEAEPERRAAARSSAGTGKGSKKT